MADARLGLFDGFEGYQTAQDSDLAAVLSGGIVALDTNVLLDLYRFGADARGEFLNVLERLADRLFVPHQAMLEFWRNRNGVLEEVGSGGTEGELRKARSSTLAIVERWQARTRALDEARMISADVERLYDDVEARVQRVGGRLDTAAAADTSKDPVLQSLATILEGAVGQPFEDSHREELIAEGRRRFAEEIPPGYLDAAKQGQGEAGTGDYLLWEQILARAQDMNLDVLLVTRDSKADWWRVDRQHRYLGPRVELVEEFKARASQRFFMVRPQALLEAAKRLLDVSVSASIEDLDRLSFEYTGEDDDQESVLWDARSLAVLLQRLRESGYSTQADVIEEASTGTGTVERERIYQIGQYDPARKLTAFSRPVTRLVQALVDEGQIPEGLWYPLTADFDDGPGRATSFSIPPSLHAAGHQAMQSAPGRLQGSGQLRAGFQAGSALGPGAL